MWKSKTEYLFIKKKKKCLKPLLAKEESENKGENKFSNLRITLLEVGEITEVSKETGKILKSILSNIVNKYDELNCFCGMVDRRKTFSLISRRENCQRSSPSRISDTPQAGFKPIQNLSSGLVEWICGVMITNTPRRMNIHGMWMLPCHQSYGKI